MGKWTSIHLSFEGPDPMQLPTGLSVGKCAISGSLWLFKQLRCWRTWNRITMCCFNFLTVLCFFSSDLPSHFWTWGSRFPSRHTAETHSLKCCYHTLIPRLLTAIWYRPPWQMQGILSTGKKADKKNGRQTQMIHRLYQIAVYKKKKKKINSLM